MSYPIVRRAQWGAVSARGPYAAWPTGEPTGHTIHWEGAGGHADHNQCPGEVRSIQAYHLNNGYIDIAYNWVVCAHGVTFEGRPEATAQSAAQRDGNRHRIAVCFMGGPLTPFTHTARAAINHIVAADLTFPDHKVIGHEDEPSCATSCPGPIADWIRAGRPVPTGGPEVPRPQLPPQGVHHPVLRQGAVGPAVLELQRKLNVGAGQHLAVDGQFGPRTREAVINVQLFFHLGADGIAGPKTWGLVDYCAALHGG